MRICKFPESMCIDYFAWLEWQNGDGEIPCGKCEFATNKDDPKCVNCHRDKTLTTIGWVCIDCDEPREFGIIIG